MEPSHVNFASSLFVLFLSFFLVVEYFMFTLFTLVPTAHALRVWLVLFLS